jgi:hypothetical protein
VESDRSIFDILKEQVPTVIEEYFKAPWDYKIWSPVSMDDKAELSIVLAIGESKRDKQYTVTLDISKGIVQDVSAWEYTNENNQ